MQSVSSRVQSERCLGACAITEMKSFKQWQLFTAGRCVRSLHRHRAVWATNTLSNFYLLSHVLYNSIITLVFWRLSQESLPYPGPVLGWLFVCQHERVHCRDSGRWASSPIPRLPVPWWQALIKWTSARPCSISVTVRPANKIHSSPVPRLLSQPTEQSRKQT